MFHVSRCRGLRRHNLEFVKYCDMQVRPAPYTHSIQLAHGGVGWFKPMKSCCSTFSKDCDACRMNPATHILKTFPTGTPVSGWVPRRMQLCERLMSRWNGPNQGIRRTKPVRRSTQTFKLMVHNLIFELASCQSTRQVSRSSFCNELPGIAVMLANAEASSNLHLGRSRNRFIN